MLVRRKVALAIFFLVTVCGSYSAFSETKGMEVFISKAGPDGWEMRDPVESFTPETLFEHINGQADLFIQYGYQNSLYGVYRKSDSDDRIEVDVYDMGNPLQAFGVFSRFRQGESASAGIGSDSFTADQQAAFYKGRYFVLLQSTTSVPSTLKQLARDLDSRINDNSPPPKEISFFPSDGLKPCSIEYYPEGLLGHEFLKRGFRAAYFQGDGSKSGNTGASEDRDLILFFSIFENADQAREALKLFKENLTQKGKASEVPSRFGPATLTGTDPYQGKIIAFQKGAYLLGAVGFEDEKDGERKLGELVQGVK